MPKYTQHQYLRYGTRRPVGSICSEHLQGHFWGQVERASTMVSSFWVWHGWQSREWGTPAQQRYPWPRVAPQPKGLHSSSPSAQEPKVSHSLALEISSLMLSSESYSWKQKLLKWPWQGVISKAAGQFSGFWSPFEWLLKSYTHIRRLNWIAYLLSKYNKNVEWYTYYKQVNFHKLNTPT